MKELKVILIVDDVDTLREELSSIMNEEGYHVLQAKNGRQAMSLLTKESVHLLITDIFMPEMDGIELGTKVREKFPAVKLIIMSGGGRKFDSGNEYEYLSTCQKLLNPDSVLKKPFSIVKLLSTIENLMAIEKVEKG